MNTSNWFDDIPILGKLPIKQAIVKLREVGEQEAADMLEVEEENTGTSKYSVFGVEGSRSWWPFQDKPWQHTAHAFGYLAPAVPSGDPLPILSVSNMHADPSLKYARIKITLDRLRVAAYPGGGTHRVLLHFFAHNQMPGKIENVHFNATYRVREGEHAGVQGYPIFVGLKIGSQGIIFKCRTINVKNEQDEKFLSFLESDAFTQGLKLISTVQPAIVPLSEMALALTKEIAKRHRNVSVQDFDLGLDFNAIPMGARLAEGAYLAVQIPESLQSVWNWNEWVYHPASGQVVKRVDPRQLIPYNYLAFSISRYDGA